MVHSFDPVHSLKPQSGKQKRTSQSQQDKGRTREMNRAYCRLRTCIPEIPVDTKLTKLKTLRMAISYIRTLLVTADSSSPKTEQVHSTRSRELDFSKHCSCFQRPEAYVHENF
ncbi:unnamed protein product [Dibothriocephalus latus]|uniref:BHLH domain-containing protein n=1 Tax=Dibothriocephalus latus TaxID=60516 RepID=A0A3P7LSQ7_DIBLA|nr:unnamed protein product [Dibothriocephalus latus]